MNYTDEQLQDVAIELGWKLHERGHWWINVSGEFRNYEQVKSWLHSPEIVGPGMEWLTANTEGVEEVAVAKRGEGFSVAVYSETDIILMPKWGFPTPEAAVLAALVEVCG